MSHVPAPEGTFIVDYDPTDGTIGKIAVVAYEVVAAIAYPITPVATGGLLNGRRALLLPHGAVLDRIIPHEFDNLDSWLEYANTIQVPGEATEPEEGNAFTEGPTNVEIETDSTDPDNEPAGRVDDRPNHYLLAEQLRAAVPKDKGRPKKRKTRSNASFWMKPLNDGSTVLAKIDGNTPLPMEEEGWTNIKRDDFAAYKKQPNHTVVRWELEDLPVETQQEGGGLDEDIADLV